MAVTGKTIPSVNVPFTDRQGRINPIWHEFLRSFVEASVDGTISGEDTVNTLTAGNGLVSTDDGNGNVTLRVGQGSGMAINADDINVDIASQTYITPVLDDEILVSDTSDNNAIRKTQVKNIVGLSAPGGVSTQVQYNQGDVFTGHSGFTYDSAGGITLNNELTISGTDFTSSSNSATSPMIFNVPAGSADTHFVFKQPLGSGSSDLPLSIESTTASAELIIENNADSGAPTTQESRILFKSEDATKWTLGLTSEGTGYNFVVGTTGLNVGVVFTLDQTNQFLTMNTALRRKTVATITASTTQTQGQGALTGEINEISTCANANDTVTLPAASAGRYCLVINNGAQTLQVFPASGDDLGAGVNTSTTIATTSRKMFVAYDSTNWEPVV